ncbi:hypothetical protein M3684_17970 [Kocuria rosea]|nr:hypothetical protein [Kocuria rosea]
MGSKDGTGASEGLPGAVELAGAIQALRDELTEAISQAPPRGVRFGVGPIELTVEAAVTKNLGGNLGIKWWLLDAGGNASRETMVTQTLTLTLEPVLVRENPDTHQIEVVDVLVSDTDKPVQSSGSETPSTPPAEPE